MTPDDVREWFDRVAESRQRLERLRLLREARESPLRGAFMGERVQDGAPASDPTERAAAALMAYEEQMDREAERLAGLVEECAQVCTGVGRALGFDVGFVLAEHYVNGATMDGLARSLGVHRTTVYAWRTSAFEWIANVGWAHAKEGTGSAAI